MIFYVGIGLSYCPVRGDTPQINAGWDNQWPISDSAIKFGDPHVAGCNVGSCAVEHVASGQVSHMRAGVYETRQEVLLWVLLLSGVPQNFSTSFGLEQTSYCLLYEEVTMLGTAADFGHACLEDTRHPISDGLDRLKQDGINHRIASRTTEGHRIGSRDTFVWVCQTPSPFRIFRGYSSGPCEYWDSDTCGRRCRCRCYSKKTRDGSYKPDSPRSVNCKHKGCSQLISKCARAYASSGCHTVSTAQGLAWSSRSRTALGRTQDMKEQAEHKQVGAASTELANAYSNTILRGDRR